MVFIMIMIVIMVFIMIMIMIMIVIHIFLYSQMASNQWLKTDMWKFLNQQVLNK